MDGGRQEGAVVVVVASVTIVLGVGFRLHKQPDAKMQAANRIAGRIASASLCMLSY